MEDYYLRLNHKKNEYFGYEISEQASLFFNAFNPEIKLINELSQLSDYKDFFDIITFSEVIEHIPKNDLNSNINVIYKNLKKRWPSNCNCTSRKHASS